MNKIVFIFSAILITLGFGYFVNCPINKAKALTHDVSLDTDVMPALTFDISSNDAVNFGDLTPTNPISAPVGGTIATVTTSASNGYTLGVHDGSNTDSALLNVADGTTYIPDYAGTIGTPTAWSGTGLGITIFAGDHTPATKWCAPAATCNSYNDVDNYYAGVPATATTAHTVTGYHAGADTSSWAFKIDVEASQKTGAYHGHVTFTATGVVI